MHSKSLGESVVASDHAKPDHLEMEIVYTPKNVKRFERQTNQYSTVDGRQFGVQDIVGLLVQNGIVVTYDFDSTPRLSQHSPPVPTYQESTEYWGTHRLA